MSFWILLWQIVLVGALVLFGSLAVWVTIGGFFDAKRLFVKLAEDHQEDQRKEQEAQDAQQS